MPDTSEPRATLPFPASSGEGAASAQPAAEDPLAGDWAEGLRGPLRTLALQRPRRVGAPEAVARAAPAQEQQVSADQRTEQADLRALAALATSLGATGPLPTPVEAEVEAPDAWASATDDQLASVPPPPRDGADGVTADGAAADTSGLLQLDAASELPADPPLHLGEEEHVLLLSDAELAEDDPHPAETESAGTPAEAAAAAPVSAEEGAASSAAAAATPSAAAPEQDGPEVRVAPDAPMPEEGMRALFAAPLITKSAGGWAAPEPIVPPASSPADQSAAVANWTAPAPAGAVAGEGHTELFAAPPIEGVAVGDDAGSTAIFAAPPLADVQAPAAGAPTSPAAAPAPAATEAATKTSPEPASTPAAEATVIAAAAPAQASTAPAATAPAPVAAETAALPPSAGGALVDEDLENTVLSLALEAMLPPDGSGLPAAAATSATAALPLAAHARNTPEAPAELEPEAEPLPEDAIAGPADPDAPWNHAEIEASSSQPIPEGAAPWETPASADAGEWSRVSPLAAVEAAWGTPSSAGPGGATLAEHWPGADTAPAAATVDSWGAAPAARPAGNHGDTWAAAENWSLTAAVPAHAEGWAKVAAPAPAEETSWAPIAAPAAEAAWAPAASTAATEWEAPPVAAPAAAPSRAFAWEAATQTGFAVEGLGGDTEAVPAVAGGASPFAKLAPGAMLSADDPATSGPSDTLAGHAPLDLDDADLLVPVYDEPVAAASPKPGGVLAVAGEHRVAVHTRAGRTRRGMVRDIDLGAGGFSLHPQSGNAVPESVQAAEVKAIFFMLPPGEKPAAGSGARVRVTFEDGRTIEGARDGQDAPGGFFLVPGDAARTNTRRIFVARGAVQELREL